MSRSVKFDQPNRADRLIPLLLFAFSLALYLRTMARDVLPGDPGEFQFAAWNWGLAHATGYPTYLLLGGTWQHLLSPIGISPALALNLFSALIAALAVALFYRLMVAWLPGAPAIRRSAAALSALMLAINPSFWSQALIAEVYALHALFIIVLMLAVQRLEPPADTASDAHNRSPILVFLLLGLSLTHHATTLLLIPGVMLALWINRRSLTHDWRQWMAALLALLLPLLLYLYIPLRSGPDASPWYTTQIGNETLSLYQSSWQGFIDFISGRSISVGFFGLDRGLANLGQAFFLWRLHFGLPGFVLMVIGLYALGKQKRWSILALTATSVVLQQLFNLFYAIEDILVYYIPLYLLGIVWIGFGAAWIGNGFAHLADSVPGEQAGSTAAAVNLTESTRSNLPRVGVMIILLCFLMPLRQIVTYQPSLDQSQADQARQSIDAILAAAPPQGAILVSNDRNEIVPLYYAQYVEQRRPDLTGLFPLIAPEARFANIGATVQTALNASGAPPTLLIKPMPGLDVKFSLSPVTPPLVEVIGSAVTSTPQFEINQQYGPLTLLGFDWLQNGANVDVRLYWRVENGLPGVYSTTVQMFDSAGSKIAQSDAAAGGAYYPTSLWQPGEELQETHHLTLPSQQAPASLLVGMYTGAELAQLAPPMMIDLAAYPLGE